MALVEGVGDEVTALAALVAALGLLGLAWFSTRTGERGDGALPAPARRDPLPADPRPAPPRPRDGGGGRQEEEGEGEEGEEEEEGSGPPFVLRLKFLNETERLARVRPRDTVGALKRLYFPGQEQLVRLIYQGQLLRDDAQTLAALHLTNNSVLHCHVAQHRPPPAGPNAGLRTDAEAAHAALNVGSLMMPLLVLMLAALWYFQLQHRHVFTATATTCLAGLTLVFSFVAFAVYRR
ncbi:transmembrane and ubiquitin-like domain-containing protein 1 [Thamnophis elegans]|uniref:transmembrane and ubiquitin-like domain-containing protein 1 n=1 Tax=Thamnophis elegans TaxID=35005 RepID=UPI0013769FB4|nr:transmembrane and ubiquitin-like domain-containing protein 1 [Thamnophis elegans]XP_032093941.1 transmembrane and ubiquitin-like domain-containing protein 1 [Thamnophis elegans]